MKRDFNPRERSLAGLFDAMITWCWSMLILLLILKLMGEL